MALISNLSVGITANMRGLDKGLAKTRKKIKSFAKSVTSIKTGIAAALGGVAITSVLSKSLDSWKEQEQAVASLQAANESMGRSAVNMTQNMIAQAAALQKEGVIGDEAIIQGQSFLSTFSQIPDELLPRATRAMVDLMAKTGKSGQSAANLIGKAAMGQASALKIAGITLSETTLEAIKAETAMKKMAKDGGINLRGIGEDGKVFKMILADIESQIGGTNKALGATASGGIQQFKNGVGDMFEIIGSVVSSGISPWARQLSVEMGLVSVNTKDMGQRFKDAMFSAALDAAPFINALNGIKLVLKTLELGFAGFELLAVTVFRSLASGASSVGGFFGMDTTGVDEALRGLNKDFVSHLSTVSNLKKELGTIYGEVKSRKLGGDFVGVIEKFNHEANQAVEKLKKPIQPEILQPKSSNQLSINSSGEASDLRPLFPKVDRTNSLLENIGARLGNMTAVAG